MRDEQDGHADSGPAAAGSWKDPFATGAIFTVVATMLAWGAFREFRPPPEEPGAVIADAHDSVRVARAHLELMRERSRITDAIDDQITALEARREEHQDRAAREDELRRLRATWHAEMKETNRLVEEQDAALRETRHREQAQRQEQIARAAHAWERSRWKLLAMAAAAAALAAWLFRQAHTRHRRQVVAEHAVESSHGLRASSRAAVDPGSAGAGDPQWNQKLVFYAVRLAVCIGAILFGLLGSAPPAGAKDEREGLVFLGLFGLAMSTIWLFFGSIDWSTWNAIKGAVPRKRPAGDDDTATSDGR